MVDLLAALGAGEFKVTNAMVLFAEQLLDALSLNLLVDDLALENIDFCLELDNLFLGLLKGAEYLGDSLGLSREFFRQLADANFVCDCSFIVTGHLDHYGAPLARH